jgi:1-deoxy-D-xylulose-5-phosphate synthase
VAIYSTFLQRAHDQIIHDVALQNLPVVFCLDRAGLVGEDGPTHHGVFDIAYLRKAPGMTVMAPRDGRELEKMMGYAATHATPIAVRYPRGAVAEESASLLKNVEPAPITQGRAEILRRGKEVLLLALGSMVYPAYEAALLLEKEGVNATVVNARFAKPLDETLFVSLAAEAEVVLTLEEGTLLGGFGSAVLELLEGKRNQEAGAGFKPAPTPMVRTLGIPDRFIEHGRRDALLDSLGLSAPKIRGEVIRLLSSKGKYNGSGTLVYAKSAE